MTIKSLERSKRAKKTTIRSAYISADLPTPSQWKSFLGDGANKTKLLRFVAEQWKTLTISRRLTVLVTQDECCWELKYVPERTPTAHIIQNLESDHEEADTRMILHGVDAARSHATVIIRSPDTDVAIICVAHQHTFSPSRLLMATGCGTRQRLINISALASQLTPAIRAALPGYHALTGCDTTSAFAGKGKKALYALVKNDDAALDVIGGLGKQYRFDEALLPDFERLVCRLYKVSSCDTVNEARYHLFATTQATEHALPPTRGALLQHLRRANYQAAVWMRSTSPLNHAPSPHHHGWTVSPDGEVSLVWTTEVVAPQGVLKSISCGCIKGGCEGRCKCFQNKLTCTDMCKCSDACTNHGSEEPVDDVDSDTES